MPFVTYTRATCLISSTLNRPILDEPEILVFLGCFLCLNLPAPQSDSFWLPSLIQQMVGRGENLFPLTSEQKTEFSRGFASLPGCEALIDLGVAQLEVAVSFASCLTVLRSIHQHGCSVGHPEIPVVVCSARGAKSRVTQRGSCCSWNWFYYASADSLPFSSSTVIARCSDAIKAVVVFAEGGWPLCSLPAIDVESADVFPCGPLSLHGFDGWSLNRELNGRASG